MPRTPRPLRRRLLALALWVPLAALAAPSGAEAPGTEGYLLELDGARVLSPEDVREDPTRFPAPVGERLEYSVSYFGVPVGTFSLEVARMLRWRGMRVVHVVAVARSNDVISKVYPIYDRTEVWVDADRMRPLRQRSRTDHGGEETWYETRYDWDTHYVHLVRDERWKGKIRAKSFDFGAHVHDIADLLYGLRQAPLEPGFRAVFPVYASRKVYEFHLRVVGRETLESDLLGEVEAVVTEPWLALDGERRSGKDDRLYVRADRPRVPVRIEGYLGEADGFLSNGVRAELVELEPGDPAWPRPPLVRWRPERWPFRSIDGMPQWEAPPAMEALREAEGLEYRNVKEYYVAAGS